jgi:hypothetical protein
LKSIISAVADDVRERIDAEMDDRFAERQAIALRSLARG